MLRSLPKWEDPVVPKLGANPNSPFVPRRAWDTAVREKYVVKYPAGYDPETRTFTAQTGKRAEPSTSAEVVPKQSSTTRFGKAAVQKWLSKQGLKAREASSHAKDARAKLNSVSEHVPARKQVCLAEDVLRAYVMCWVCNLVCSGKRNSCGSLSTLLAASKFCLKLCGVPTSLHLLHPSHTSLSAICCGKHYNEHGKMALLCLSCDSNLMRTEPAKFGKAAKQRVLQQKQHPANASAEQNQNGSAPNLKNRRVTVTVTDHIRNFISGKRKVSSIPLFTQRFYPNLSGAHRVYGTGAYINIKSVDGGCKPSHISNELPCTTPQIDASLSSSTLGIKCKMQTSFQPKWISAAPGGERGLFPTALGHHYLSQSPSRWAVTCHSKTLLQADSVRLALALWVC
eukprot:4434309-Pyramimonas_sp.AAC.1